MTQSYANSGGTGNRTSLITVTSTATSFGTFDKLVNGVSSAATDFFFNSGQTGREIRFSFAPGGFTRCITEAKWYQQNAITHGDWKWQGSNDGGTWTDIGGTFTLGSAATQTITTLSGNTNFYQFYRMLQVSGTTSSSPYLYEVEFSIDDGGGVPVSPPSVQMTQIAIEQWVTMNPDAQMTQIAVEQWASVETVNLFTARHV